MQTWYPQRIVCHATMETRRAQRLYSKRHEKMVWHDGTFARWSDKDTPATPYRYDDGVDIIVAAEDVNPTDDFLSGELKRAQMGG